jgi:hypothetical protein
MRIIGFRLLLRKMQPILEAGKLPKQYFSTSYRVITHLHLKSYISMGNADFTDMASRFGQGEAIMKGTVMLAVYMCIPLGGWKNRL